MSGLTDLVFLSIGNCFSPLEDKMTGNGYCKASGHSFLLTNGNLDLLAEALGQVSKYYLKKCY